MHVFCGGSECVGVCSLFGAFDDDNPILNQCPRSHDVTNPSTGLQSDLSSTQCWQSVCVSDVAFYCECADTYIHKSIAISVVYLYIHDNDSCA